MDVPASETFDYNRSYDFSKKIDSSDRANGRLIGHNHHDHDDILRRTLEGDRRDDSTSSKSESQHERAMKDESTNTTLSLGGQTNTTAMSLRDSEGKIHQPAQWNHKYDAEDITHFLDANMRQADTKCHQSLVQKEEGEGEDRGGVMPVMPGASVHVYSKEALAAVMQRNRQLMQTAFRHSHINGHKAFSCGICNKFFNQGSHLQQHIRTHTGERPYVCDVCRGTFTRMSDLKRHMRTHTGEKPYKCAACGNQFGDVSHLKSHIKTHTGEKPFQCAVCSKQFARQSSLKRHLRTHRNVDVEIS